MPETAIPTFVQPEHPGAGVDPQKVLFIGLGRTAVAWYRCFLPAIFLGADWIGVSGEPPKLRYDTGLVKGATQMPRFEDYEVIVIQQPRGPGWLKLIRGLQRRGIKVIYEVDDYVHAIHKMQDHDYRRYFSKPELRRLELCMSVCDAMVVSTDFIARRYRKFNREIHVCENGVDIGRYDLTLPERDHVVIGWAGGTGHAEAVGPWLNAVGAVLAARPNTHFISIGDQFADAFSEAFPHRTLSIPFTMIDSYPAAMTTFDVAIAPAGKGNFFRGKSDLRWVEAGALGIPLVADPDVYHHITHGETGFHANSPEEAAGHLLDLVDGPELRTRIGGNARAEIRASRDMRVTSQRWADVFAKTVS